MNGFEISLNIISMHLLTFHQLDYMGCDSMGKESQESIKEYRFHPYSHIYTYTYT